MTNYLYDPFDENCSEGADNQNYLIGERVVIAPDLRISAKGMQVVQGMLKYAGKTAYVKRKSVKSYHLDIDKGQFRWQDYMLVDPVGPAQPDQNDFLRMWG